MVRRRAGAQTARALLEQIAGEVAQLPGPALRAIGPVLFQAEKELAQDLAKWLRTVEDGAARFTAQQYRVALVQIRQALRTARGLNPALFNVLNAASGHAGALALGHLAREAERFSMLFEGSLRPMPIRPAAVLAEGRRALIPRFKASAARYGEYVTKDIQRELAVGVARGETFDQLTRRLMRHGGPKGMVTVRGIEGDPGAVSEHIAEGLFRRYRSRASTVVRTETINAYNVVAVDAITEAHAEDPGFMLRWDAAIDRRLCQLCRELDGKTAPVGGTFPEGYDHPPAHPCCRCATTPWHEAWGPSINSAPVEPVIQATPIGETPPVLPPAPPAPPASGGSGGPPDDDWARAWRAFGDHTERNFGRRLTEADMHQAYGAPPGFRFEVESLDTDGPSAVMHGGIFADDGRRAGDITRAFGRDALGSFVKHELLWLEDEFHGVGISDHLARSCYPKYLEWGAKRVKVFAVDKGRYAWARTGFMWAEKTVLEVQERLADFLVEGGICSPGVAADVAARYARKPWLLARLKVGGRRIGKEFLLSRPMAGYNAILELNDADEGFRNLRRMLGI